MFRYRHAAALIFGTFLIVPTLSSAQEASIPGLDLPSFDVSVAVDVPDVGAHVPEFTDFNVSDPGIASGISEALVRTAAGIIEEVGDDAQLANIDLQNILQKQQQQLLQTLSSISKLVEEEVRKGKGGGILILSGTSELLQGRVILDFDFSP